MVFILMVVSVNAQKNLTLSQMCVKGKLIKIADTIVRKRENYIDNYGVKYDESAKLITTILHKKAYK